LFRDNVEIGTRLARQAGDGRVALLPLLTHDNPQVRLEAAKFGYAVAPTECKACLEAIAAAKLPDQSLDAGMTLWRLSEDPHCLDGTPPNKQEPS
jgi:hypothetical protein